MNKLQHIVFIPSTNIEELRQSLRKLELEFFAVRIDNNPYLMVVTDQLGQMKKIAKELNLSKLYISDCYRETFRLDLDNNSNPTKLGKLSRVSKEEAKVSSFSFSIYDDGNTFYYATN